MNMIRTLPPDKYLWYKNMCGLKSYSSGWMEYTQDPFKASIFSMPPADASSYLSISTNVINHNRLMCYSSRNGVA